MGHGYPDWAYEVHVPPEPMQPGKVPDTDPDRLKLLAGIITRKEYEMAENKKNKPRAVPGRLGDWDTSDPLYVADLKDQLDSYYEKNIEAPFEPDPGNYCDDCREGKPHHVDEVNGQKVKVHKHVSVTPVPAPCSVCGGYECPGAPRFKGICPKDKRIGEFEEQLEKLIKSNVPTLTGYTDIDGFLNECLDTMRRKGHDYRQGNDDDLLHNFRSVGVAVDEDMMKVWFTYFYKHYSAVVTYIKEGGQSESEPIDGRIKDMIVYLLLFYRMTQERGRQMYGVIS
jgi:hypothetical protein